MHPKRKTPTPKETWQANRARYTWHLRPFYSDKFDSSHWWEGQPNRDPVAALYELVRRHPLVAEREPLYPPGREPRIRPPSIFGPHPSLRCTRRLGMKSWPKLTESEQREWKSSLGKLKGFDFRPKESLCRNITSQAPLAVEQERTEAHKTFTEMFPGLPDIGYLCGYFANPTDREWKKAIAHCAVEACRGGYILFALAPDLAAAEAGALMVAAYRDYLKLYPPANRRQRARPQDWLALISAFEDDVARGPKTNPQIFAQYRRVLDGIRFAQARPRV